MIIQKFSVYDQAAESFIEDFPAQTIAMAIRMFTDACQNTNNNFYKHAPDFTLFHIASWDSKTATTTNLKAPIPIATALEFAKETN